MESDKPLVSIITVVRNGVKVLEECILSVIEQSDPDTEYIIVDGYSQDGTIDIIRKYEKSISYWISEPDLGIYDAMNKGTKIAKGDWILFIGSDDILLSGFKQIKSQLKDKAVIYYGNAFWMNSKRKYDGRFTSFKFMLRNISHQAILYPRIVFENYQFNLKFIYLADYHLNMICWGDKTIKFKYINVTISKFNDDGLSAKNPDLEFNLQKKSLIKKNFKMPFFLYYVLRRYLLELMHIKSKRILNG